MSICRILSLQNAQEWPRTGQWLKDRANPGGQDVELQVREILDNVRTRGDEALVEYTAKFDCPQFEGAMRLSEMEIAMGAAQLPAEDRDYIAQAASNIRAFHEMQKEKTWMKMQDDGTILGQIVNPVGRVGLYVPGGKGGNTPLVSSFLMNAIPAIVAGVPEIAVCTPPREDGTLNPVILAAAHLLDITEVYRVGGAWSIAGLAYGTQSIPAVDVIAGPGNLYVATAKRLVQGQVGIDMIAGPSEVCIIADSSANPRWTAADMLSQAEHDPLASAVCIVTDNAQAEAIGRELEEQCASLPRATIASRSLVDWGAIVVVPNLTVALEIANTIAPEHLELSVRDPWSLVPFVRNAGAVFMGHYSPEPLGDYFAGPNHVLPTLGTARFSSALSVQTFCKKTSVISASRTFQAESKEAVAALARLEGLEAHARSIESR